MNRIYLNNPPHAYYLGKDSKEDDVSSRMPTHKPSEGKVDGLGIFRITSLVMNESLPFEGGKEQRDGALSIFGDQLI